MEHWITLLGCPGPCPISWWLPWVILRIPPLPASLLCLIPCLLLPVGEQTQVRVFPSKVKIQG